MGDLRWRICICLPRRCRCVPRLHDRRPRRQVHRAAAGLPQPHLRLPRGVRALLADPDGLLLQARVLCRWRVTLPLLIWVGMVHLAGRIRRVRRSQHRLGSIRAAREAAPAAPPHTFNRCQTGNDGATPRCGDGQTDRPDVARHRRGAVCSGVGAGGGVWGVAVAVSVQDLLPPQRPADLHRRQARSQHRQADARRGQGGVRGRHLCRHRASEHIPGGRHHLLCGAHPAKHLRRAGQPPNQHSNRLLGGGHRLLLELGRRGDSVQVW
mmetsp:Transcript_24254/g.59893  ORF Transcript_24254/g.59893 Transcript_24254/m.59893 type:complete len:267 (-) Transcript_24254:67-867(-)